LDKLWEREVGEGYSGPIVAGNRVWVHARDEDREVVSCLTLDQGQLLWSNRYAARFQQDPSGRAAGKGPYSTPTLSDGRLFTLGITTILSAWDAETGILLWRRDYSPVFEPSFPYFGTAASPLVWGDSCYVHFGGHDRGKPDLPGHGAMTALSVLDGKEKWRWDGDAPAVGASPIISVIGGQLQLVFKTERKIVGLDPHTGRELWKIPFKVPMDNTIVTPLVVGDQLLTSDYQMGMRAWRIQSDGGSWTATEHWRNPRVSLFMSSPVLSGGQLVGFSETRSGELFGLDPGDGKLLWRGEPRWGEYASLIAWGDEVLVFREDGSLVVGEVSGDHFRIVQRYRLSDSSAAWGHAAISDNRIIARYGSRLAVFQVGGASR
jgi:outer membrane protein assembly factor BamB